MTFRDFVDYFVSECFSELPHRGAPRTPQEYQAEFAAVITAAASDMAGKVSHHGGGIGLEVDTATDYDPTSDSVVAEVHLRMIGFAPYHASAALLEQGFVFLAEDATFTTTVRVSLDHLRELRQ